MGRAKKRLQKKQPVKKVVRRTPQQQENKLTPEQKARENEMIKAMLVARPATQINPGISQLNDKMQQQIDMLNKRLIEESNKTDAKKQEKQAVENRLTQETSAREQLQNEINALKEEHKSKRKLLNVQQQGKDTKDEYEEKIDALQRELDKLDETTEQGKVIAEMERIKAETREIKRKIEDADRQIKSNRLYGELQDVRTENEKAQAECDALQQIITSDDFQRPSPALIDAYKRKQLSKYNNEQLKRVMDMKEKTNEENAEVLGKQQFEEYVNSPQFVYELDRNSQPKTNLFGPIVKRDAQGKPMMVPALTQQWQQIYARQLQIKLDAERRGRELDGRIFGTSELLDKVIKESVEASQREAELRAKEDYYKSENFRKQTKDIENKKAELKKQEQDREIREAKLEQAKKITTMQVQNEVMKQNAQDDVDYSVVLTSIQALGESAAKSITKQQEIDESEEHREQLLKEFGEIYDALGSNGGWDRRIAQENFLRMITDKTGGKLPNNIEDYNNANLEKAVSFGEMLLNANKYLLVNESQIKEFEESKEYKDFEWDLSKTLRADEVM